MGIIILQSYDIQRKLHFLEDWEDVKTYYLQEFLAFLVLEVKKASKQVQTMDLFDSRR